MVSPVFHWYLNPAGAESTTDPEMHNDVGPFVVMIGVSGVVPAVTTIGAETALVQVPLWILTEKVPEEVTLMVRVVAPLFHKYLNPASALSCVESDPHQVIGPYEYIYGIGSIVSTDTTVATEAALVQVPTMVRTV